MVRNLAMRLATHAVWPAAVQRILAAGPAGPAGRDALWANLHLDADVVADLAATCTPQDLPQLTQNQRHGIDGLRACLRRAADLYADAEPWDNLDFEVAWTLLHGDGPHRVRDLEAEIAAVPTDGSTAWVCYAAGVTAARLEVVARFERADRARWLTSPDATGVDDDTAHVLLSQRSDEPVRFPPSCEHAIACVLLQRPALLAELRNQTEGEDPLSRAARLLVKSNYQKTLALCSPSKRATRFAFCLETADEKLVPYALAQATSFGGWSQAERTMLGRYIDPKEFARQLGWLAPEYAAYYGRDVTVPLKYTGQLTWEGLQELSPEVENVDLPDPASTPVVMVTHEYAKSAADWLTTDLADLDPQVTAARWQVVLTAAPTFDGTVGELAAVAHGVAAPAAA